MNDVLMEVKNLYKLYGGGKTEAMKMLQDGISKDDVYKKTGVTAALVDVSMEIRKGEIFVIIGLSGSGKSTLVRCFNLLNRPTKGTVKYEGADISKFEKMSSGSLGEARCPWYSRTSAYSHTGMFSETLSWALR